VSSPARAAVSRRSLVLLVATPAVLCALVGLTHPATLDASSALYWRNLHLALIPVFPLIGLAPWLVARRGGKWLGRLGGLFGYGFAIFYTALDILAGVAGGALINAGDTASPVFEVARVLGFIGVVSLVLGCLVASLAAFRAGHVRTLPGAVLACAGAVLVQPFHIYAGLGTLAMLLLAGGFVVLVLTGERRPDPVA
jgi:hypothetical protein